MQEDRMEELKALSYEQAFQKLEQLVRSLERGDLPLADCAAAYAEGQSLLKLCRERLTAYQQQLEIALPGSDQAVDFEVPEA